MGEHERFEEIKQITVEDLAEILGSSRLAELFHPLIVVAPQNLKGEIIQYAKDLAKERLAEMTLSQEATVLLAILQCVNQGFMRHGKILIKDVTAQINKDLDYAEQWSNRQVGAIIGRLGFEKVRTKNGNALIWNPSLIERLKKDPRYTKIFELAEQETEENSSFMSQKHSPSSTTFTNNWLQGSEEIDGTET